MVHARSLVAALALVLTAGVVGTHCTVTVGEGAAPDAALEPPPDAPGAAEAPDSVAPSDARAPDAPGQPDAPDAAPPRCAPTAVPAAVRTSFGLSAFYTKYIGVGGFPIVSSSKAPDAALCAARAVVERLVEHRPELLGRLAEKKIRLAVMAESEVTTDIPEHSDLTPKDYWDQRARGLGATLARPAVSCAEENVLCAPGDRYRGESILVHELSHAIFDMAIDLYEPTVRPRLTAAYAAAQAAGRFQGTYAITNESEYWAEGAQDWFDTNLRASPPDGVHNEISTRAQLKTYDPALAALLAEVFGDRAWRYACP